MVTAMASYDTGAERRDGVSWRRLLWVAPLTVVVALLVNLVDQDAAPGAQSVPGRDGATRSSPDHPHVGGGHPGRHRLRADGLAGAPPDSLVPHRGSDRAADQSHPRSAARLWRRSAADGLSDGGALHPLWQPVLSGATGRWRSAGWAISWGGSPRVALGSGADPDAAACGHCGRLHRVADDADARSSRSSAERYALFRTSLPTVTSRQEFPGRPVAFSRTAPPALLRPHSRPAGACVAHVSNTGWRPPARHTPRHRQPEQWLDINDVL